MKLLLSSLLLASLCDLSSWSVSSAGAISVTQSPDVSVMEGEAVNITCCWTGTSGKAKVNWLKNLSKIRFIKENETLGNCSNLIFTNITKEDSERYICKVTVDIPVLAEVIGNGTVITVLSSDNTKNNSTGEGSSTNLSTTSSPMVIALAVVVPLLLIMLVYFCILQRKKALAARVIYEVPHIDSEEVDMDKHSTSSSRGSSQWCQVPVYESVDYFEQVERKESG